MPVPFTKNDLRINRKGRPKKEFSLTQGLRDFMSQKDPKTKKTYREALTQKVLRMALGGDLTAIRLVFNYVEGTPKPVSEYIGVSPPITLVEFLTSGEPEAFK